MDLQEQMDELMEREQLRDFPLEFTDTESTLVASATYTPGQEQLLVELKAGQVTRMYRYSGVPAKVWKEFHDARSHGAYFTRFIRPMFEGVPC